MWRHPIKLTYPWFSPTSTILSSPWKRAVKCTKDTAMFSGIRELVSVWECWWRFKRVESCSPQSALTQSLTGSNFYPLNCIILYTKSYIKNSQTTYVHIHGTIQTGPENNYFLPFTCIDGFSTLRSSGVLRKGRDLPALYCQTRNIESYIKNSQTTYVQFMAQFKRDQKIVIFSHSLALTV